MSPADQLQAGKRLRTILGSAMAAVIAIAIFIAVILVLNVLEFGRPD